MILVETIRVEKFLLENTCLHRYHFGTTPADCSNSRISEVNDAVDIYTTNTNADSIEYSKAVYVNAYIYICLGVYISRLMLEENIMWKCSYRQERTKRWDDDRRMVMKNADN